MFFWLSKIFWFLIEPFNLLFLVICLTAVAAALKWTRTARTLSVMLAVTSLLVAVFPVGGIVIQSLENRFPANPDLPDRIDGIIVLGGVMNAHLSQARGQPQLGSGLERVAETVRLMRRFPGAKVVFSGGSGDPLRQELKEAHVAPEIFALFGVDAGRVVYESQSRNTAENARLSFDMMKPRPGEAWVLVTSAFHMPRSVGVFRKAGWPVIAYPVDFLTTGTQTLAPTLSFRGGFSGLSGALHECLGLLVYWLTDRTDTLVPGPAQ